MSKIVQTGIVRNKNDNLLYPYVMRTLKLENMHEILALQHEILSGLKNPEVCIYLSNTEVEDILKGSGEMVGVFVSNTMIAIGASLFPGESDHNLGRDIGLCKNELMKVAHLEFTAVHPSYRGNSLQKKIGGYLFKSITEDGRWDYLMNTISPYNPKSLDTGFYFGLHIKKLLRKYEKVLRYVLFYDIKNPFKADKNTIISVLVSDLESQQELLGQGYCGIGFEKGSKNERMLFGKVVSK